MAKKQTATHAKTLSMVQLAFFAALIIVLQLVSNYVKVGAVSITLTLIPLVLGGIYFSYGGAAILGVVFGCMCVVLGLSGVDAGTGILLQTNPVMTTVIAILKGVLAAVGSCAVYRLFMKLFKGKIYFASLMAYIAAPIINTGLFLLGAYVFLWDTVVEKFAVGYEDTTFIAIFVGIFMINFIAELAINVIIGPAVTSLLSKNKSVKKLLK